MENTDNYYVQPEGIWIIDEEKNTAFRMSSSAVGVKIHRLKSRLQKQFKK